MPSAEVTTSGPPTKARRTVAYPHTPGCAVTPGRRTMTRHGSTRTQWAGEVVCTR